jgi:hypothetical protein
VSPTLLTEITCVQFEQLKRQKAKKKEGDEAKPDAEASAAERPGSGVDAVENKGEGAVAGEYVSAVI